MKEIVVILIYTWTRFGCGAGQCVNNYGSCDYWAGIKECEHNPGFMRCECALACSESSRCQTGEATPDTNCLCASNASLGLCEHGHSAPACPLSCSKRQTVSCGPPDSYPNAIAIGNDRFLDYVTYMCRQGYSNNGNVGRRVCLATGVWAVLQDTKGLDPNCVQDPSFSVPCETSLIFTRVARASVSSVGVLNSKPSTSSLVCADWCLRTVGCTHFTRLTDGQCRIYYNIGSNEFSGRIDEGDVWKKTTNVQLFYDSSV